MRIEPRPDGSGHVLYIDFKALTRENWLQPDPVCLRFARNVGGQMVPMTGEDWVTEILTPRLNPSVPLTVTRLYEAARGAMLYGFFFHPLYALAEEQLFRTLEAACTHKCRELKAPLKVRTFEHKIDHLANAGLIKAEDVETWHALRDLRNITSHPEDHSLAIAPHAVATLREVTDKINHLFA